MLFRNKQNFVQAMIQERGGISTTKYARSEAAYSNRDMRKCPVTVSEAVDYYLSRAGDIGFGSYPTILQDGDLRTQLVLGYFSVPVEEPLIYFNGHGAPGFVSPERTSRLEGELRRFGGDILLRDPRGVRITPELADRYCERCNVPGLRELIQQSFKV